MDDKGEFVSRTDLITISNFNEKKPIKIKTVMNKIMKALGKRVANEVRQSAEKWHEDAIISTVGDEKLHVVEGLSANDFATAMMDLKRSGTIIKYYGATLSIVCFIPQLYYL